MRGGAEWIADKEGLTDLPETPDWIGIGYGVADIGFVLLVIAALAAWLTLRRGATAGVKIAAVIVGFVILMDVIAIWAMTTKPV
jgi:tetrahydromethanopterin S-methyltransferase subunit C